MALVVLAPDQPSRDNGHSLQAALVNNMPDAAFLPTERQFLGLLEAGAEARGVTIEVRRYAFSALARGPKVVEHMAGRYFPLSDLWSSHPDLVVVTGSEPKGETLETEPFWPETVRLLDWADRRPTSVLLSCLAAHLALRALAGPDRILLPAKRTGVFAHRIARASGLTAGMGPSALVPHSRLNDVPLRAVERAGYDAVLATPEVGWTAAVGRLGPSDLLLLQGHPEYEPSSLLREYRRDALRYLSGERDQPPVLPPGCVGATDVAAIEALHRRVLSSPRDPEAFAAFEFEAAAARVPWTWRPTATQLYANWVAQAAARRGLLPADGGRERAVPEAGPPEPVVAAV